jgi:hypothetical protein
MRHILHTISIWIIVLPLLAGIINFKGLNKDSKWIFWLVIVAFIPQILTFLIKQESPLLNISYNLYTPLELGMLYMVFIDKYEQNTSRRIVQASLLIYIPVFLFMFIKYGITASFLSTLVCINNIIYMIWILLLLKEQYQAEDSIIQKNNPFAWYLLALIIYAPCTVLVFALYYYIRDPENPVERNLWIIHSSCNILLYILFTVGLSLHKKHRALQTKTSSL